MGVEPTGGGDPANLWCEGERWPRSPVCSTPGEGEKKKKKKNSGREVNICSPNTNCCLEVNKTNNQPLEREPSHARVQPAGRAAAGWPGPAGAPWSPRPPKMSRGVAAQGRGGIGLCPHTREQQAPLSHQHPFCPPSSALCQPRPRLPK